MKNRGEPFRDAATLRESFDRAFADAPRPPAQTLDFLAVGIAGARFVIRLGDTAGLYADRVIVPLPTSVSELLGIASFRNVLAPVFDLRTILGYAVSVAPRWLVLARAPQPIGLAFDSFDGQLRVSPSDVAESARGAGTHLAGVLTTQDGARPVIDFASVLEAITRRARSGAQKET
jgi:chemotaxis signal transduction protein